MDLLYKYQERGKSIHYQMLMVSDIRTAFLITLIPNEEQSGDSSTPLGPLLKSISLTM
jgi:hypothetical protein